MNLFMRRRPRPWYVFLIVGGFCILMAMSGIFQGQAGANKGNNYFVLIFGIVMIIVGYLRKPKY